MKKTLSFFMLLFCFIISAQKSEYIYEKLRSELNTSPKEFFKNIEKEKLKALASQNLKLATKLDYLRGFGYYLNNNADSCVFYANEAINRADNISYIEGKALGLRLLGTQYAKMGLLYESDSALDKGLLLIKHLDNEEANDLRGSLYASKLVLMDDTVNQEQKLNVAKKSIQSYERLKSLKRKKRSFTICLYKCKLYVYKIRKI